MVEEVAPETWNGAKRMGVKDMLIWLDFNWETRLRSSVGLKIEYEL